MMQQATLPGAANAVEHQIQQPQLSIFEADPIGPPSKRCAHCRETKPCSEFHADRSQRGGLARICRNCEAARKRQRWIDDPEGMRTKARQRYQANIKENRSRSAERRRSERGKALNRLAVARYVERNSEKRTAHNAVRRAIRAGTLPPPVACEFATAGECSGRVEYHHDNYDRPLDVRALCSHHQNEMHHKPRALPRSPDLFDLALGAI